MAENSVRYLKNISAVVKYIHLTVYYWYSRLCLRSVLAAVLCHCQSSIISFIETFMGQNSYCCWHTYICLQLVFGDICWHWSTLFKTSMWSFVELCGMM